MTLVAFAQLLLACFCFVRERGRRRRLAARSEAASRTNSEASNSEATRHENGGESALPPPP
ncbi:MAG: hypothetical protein JNL90_10090 [Planctomycetes bacterium]|nr:hypothetical protein [Planctomycetota bacterium]